MLTSYVKPHGASVESNIVDNIVDGPRRVELSSTCFCIFNSGYL